MRLGATLYIRNTAEAAGFYQEAFGLTLGYHEIPSGLFVDQKWINLVLPER